MSNKTSDKNVANIEKDIKNIKQYINLVLDKSYCDCNELNVISTGKHCDGSKNVAYSMQNILAELEQKDKRIQELEGENERKDKFIKMAKEVIDNSILKQVVIDKIDELKLSGGSDGKDNVENLVRELTIDILQELLEGERK